MTQNKVLTAEQIEERRAYKQAWRDKNRKHINDYQQKWRKRYKKENGVSYDVMYKQRRKQATEQTSVDDE